LDSGLRYSDLFRMRYAFCLATSSPHRRITRSEMKRLQFPGGGHPWYLADGRGSSSRARPPNPCQVAPRADRLSLTQRGWRCRARERSGSDAQDNLVGPCYSQCCALVASTYRNPPAFDRSVSQKRLFFRPPVGVLEFSYLKHKKTVLQRDRFTMSRLLAP
jgi:hypothetical protein